MRRQKSVCHRQSCQHGQSDIYSRKFVFINNGKNKRNKQDESNAIEQRNADYESRYHQSPLNVLCSKQRDHDLRDLLCGSTFSDQFAQHRTQYNDDGQAAEDISDAVVDGCRQFIERYSQCNTCEYRGDDESNEGVHLEQGDEHNQNHQTENDNQKRHCSFFLSLCKANVMRFSGNGGGFNEKLEKKKMMTLTILNLFTLGSWHLIGIKHLGGENTPFQDQLL